MTQTRAVLDVEGLHAAVCGSKVDSISFLRYRAIAPPAKAFRNSFPFVTTVVFLADEGASPTGRALSHPASSIMRRTLVDLVHFDEYGQGLAALVKRRE